jgi:hypothetical protein
LCRALGNSDNADENGQMIFFHFFLEFTPSKTAQDNRLLFQKQNLRLFYPYFIKIFNFNLNQ